jgi:hypothetical protein
MIVRIPALLLALPLLPIVRLLPDHGAGLWFRLAAATLVLVLPGRLVAWALGLRTGAAALAWTLAALAGALALTFAVRASLALTLWLLLAAGIVALPLAVLRRSREPARRWRLGVVVAGIALGIAVWHVAGIVHGDELFHLGRVRKLDDFGSLSLRSVDEFRDGGLHPGYAFPLWHAFLACVARLAGVDPAAVVVHEPSVLVPAALLVAFEAGLAAFRSAWLGLAVVAAQVALIALAPGGGGSYATLAVPGTVARQLLVPAVLALFFRFVRDPSWQLGLTLAACSMDLAFVHPTYALFLAIPLGGFVVARFALARVDLRAGIAGLGALLVPTALVFWWLLPIVRETASHNPSAAEKARALAQYHAQLDVFSASRYRLAPEIVARGGAVAVAALVLVPLAGLAARRRWAAFVLGGTLVVLALELVTWIFPHFSDAVSLSQSRRAAGFVPFAFAFAGGAAVLARLVGPAALGIALGAGIWLQLAYPGDFELGSGKGGPALATWIAALGAAAGLAAGVLLTLRYGRLERAGWIAGCSALLFVLPVAVHGFSNWSAHATIDRGALTPGLVRALRRQVPKRAVVFADPETSYRISAYAPLYVADAPPAHVADTKANDPYGRLESLKAFLYSRHPGRLAIPRRYHAGWIVLRGRERRLKLGLPRVYSDREFTVYRLGGSRP